MKKLIFLNLFILTSLVSAEITCSAGSNAKLNNAKLSSAKEAVAEKNQFELEDAIEKLDVQTVIELLKTEIITPDRLELLKKQSREVTNFYRMRTKSLHSKEILKITGATLGICLCIAFITGGSLSVRELITLKKERKKPLNTVQDSEANQKESNLLLFTACIPLGLAPLYHCIKTIIRNWRLDNAITEFKKARQIEYLINKIK